MLESLVANVLNRVLGAYVSNLEYNQLNIAIWTGMSFYKHLSISRLKKEALDKFDLPIEVLEGYLGELTLNIPWSNLRNKPVKVFINNVYLLAVPRADTEYDPEEEERRAQQLKEEKLANSELLQTTNADISEEDNQKNQSFVTQLVTKIIDNLQISINNIHIRYEDKLSDPDHHFAVGLTLSEFSAVSTDANWKPTFIEEETIAIHKLITLGSLAIYWNTDSRSLAGHKLVDAIRVFNQLIASEKNDPTEHQYILKPVSGTGRVTMNKQVDLNTPKNSATLLFDELGFVLDDEQYRDALLMIGLFHFYLRQQQYRKFRPPKEITPKEDPRAWFQFAINAICSEIHERNRKLTWAYFAERRDDRKAYIEYYKNKMLARLPIDDHAKLAALEKKLSFEDIRFYRSIARSKLRKEKAIIARIQKAQQRQQQSGWLSSWWYGGQTEGDSSTDPDSVLTDAQRQELYNAIDFDEKAAVAKTMEIPREAIKLSLKTQLKTGSFALKKEPHGSNSSILCLTFDNVTTNFIQRPDSFLAESGLGSLIVDDGTTEGTLFPQIVRVKKDYNTFENSNDYGEHESNPASRVRTDQSDECPFFQFVFERNPLDGRADNGFSMKMRPLEIVYNQNAIDSVVQFFKPPDQQLVSTLIEAAGDTIEGIKAQTRAGLEYALEEHKTIDVKIDMNAPIIIIPDSCTRKDAQVVVLDSGHIRVQSDLVSKEVIAEIQSKESTSYSEEDYKHLESLMYDRFSVDLSSTQVLVGQSVERCLEQIRNPNANHDLHLIDRMNLQFFIEMSILPQASNLTKFKVSGHLPLLKANFSDRKYKIVMKIVDLITPKSEEVKETEPEPITPKPHYQVRDSLMREKLGLSKGYIDYYIDSGTEDEDDAEEHEFYDAEEQELPQAAKVNQRIFEFNFKVDKFSTAVKKANRDPTKPETLLVDMVLEHFNLNFVLRPFDMSAEIFLKSLSIEDKMSYSRSEFKHLAASEGYGSSQTSDSSHLVHIKYVSVNPQSPEYMTRFEGIDQSVDIELSTISVIITRKSILKLYDFLLDTFTAPPGTPVSATSPNLEAASDTPQVQKKASQKQNTMRVKVRLSSIVFILNNDGVRLATGKLSQADVAVLMRQTTMRVGARIGGFSLLEDISQHGNGNTSFRELLTIEGEEIAVFKYETYDESELTYPGYDSMVYLRTGSARLTFLEEPIRLLLEFGSKFAQMKGLYDSARMAAYEQAAQLQEKVQKFHFDIVIPAPIVVFPISPNSNDLIVAHLGELSASNKFLKNDEGNEFLTQINAELKSIRMTSQFYSSKGNFQELQIIKDVDINFKISSCEHVEGSLRPDMEIIGKMSDVRMNLTEKQYKSLMDLSNSVVKVLGSGDGGSEPVQATQSSNLFSSSMPYSPTFMPKQPPAPKPQDSENVWTSIDLTFDVNQIYLEIFEGDVSQTQTLAEKSLSIFSLNKTGLKLKMLTDGLMEAELRLQSVTLNDTRPKIKNVFREILPANNKESPQFLVNLQQSSGTEKFILAIVTVDSPKIIFTLDHLFAVRDYFMSAFDAPSSSEIAPPEPKQITALKKSSTEPYPIPPPKPPRPSRHSTFQSESSGQSLTPLTQTLSPPKESESSSAETPALSLNYRVNISHAEIILLANPEITSTEAIILSADEIVVTQQGIMALGVSKLGMFLCRMDKRDATLLRWIDNFDISMSMDNRTSKPGQQSTEINIEVTNMIMRVSYRDVMLIMSILNKLSELSSRSAAASSVDEKSAEAENSSGGTLSRSFDYSNFNAIKKDPNASGGGVNEKQSLILRREKLRATLQGTQLVMIGDEHDIPMIDMNATEIIVNVADWSSQIKVDTTVSTRINYFNLTNSHWEPLIEPWQYTLHASKANNESLIVDVTSQIRLEVNITHIFLETMLTSISILGRQQEHVLNTARGSRTPYILRNKTGYDMHVWAVSPNDNNEAVIQKLADGCYTNWRFDDWRKTRETMTVTKNMLGLQFEGARWESIKDIPVDREGETLYILRPKLNNISHRLVCDIKLKDNIKYVTFRSALVIENRTLLTIEMMVVDAQGQKLSKVYQIDPGEDCPVPIESTYHHQLKFRPEGNFGYDWNVASIYWKDFLKKDPIKSISCKSIRKDVPFRFQVNALYKKNNPILKEYPHMSIRLSAPVQIENLLPYDCEFRIFDKSTKYDWPNNKLKKGCVHALHLVELGHLLLLSVDVQATDFKPSEWAIISTPNEDFKIDDTLTLTDPEGLKLNLRISYHEIPESGGAFKYTIYSPYVMINKTGLDMAAPYMFSYPSDEIRNRALLKVGDSNWSRSLSFEAVGSFMEVVIPSAQRMEEIHVGVSIQEGDQKYKKIKIVTFTPRFILKNNTNEDLNFREPGSSNFTLLASKDRAALHFLKQGDVKQLTICYPGHSNPWSAPFNINELGRVHVKMGKKDQEPGLIRTEILLEDATIFIIFSKEEGKWPYRVENFSDVDVVFYQQDPHRREASASRPSMPKYHLAPGNSEPYSWDSPAIKDKRLVLNVNDHERLINIQEIGSLVPFKYPSKEGGHKALSIEVVADGPTQVVYLTNYKQSESIFRPLRSSMSTKSDTSTKEDGFEEIDVDTVTTLIFQVKLEGIGISIINKRMQELAYASMRGMELKYSDSTLYQSINFVVRWLQIDNQLYGGLYPIIFYPILPKDSKGTVTHPNFQSTLIKAKDDSHGVIYIKYCSVLLQEMNFEIDEDFLFALLDFLKLRGLTTEDDTEKELQLFDGSLDIPEPKSNEGDDQLYFEVLHIQPMKINISFVRTERINVEDKPAPRNPLMFFFNVLTMAIGNINDAPIKLNALFMENLRVSAPVLLDRFQQHYGQEFFYQVHKIVGSADFLGNPVGLFNNLGSGVAAIFYEPYQGFIMHDRPQDFGIGLARGTASFFKKTVYGFSDSVSKFTGSIGKGLSVATMDKSFQDRRRMAQLRNRPKHLGYGVKQGANSFITSIESGIEGLVRKPIEGVEKEGAAGLVKGFGKGIVGLVTKPVVGVFDLASNVTEGIRNTTTVFDDNEIAPVRLPRYVGRDGILRPYDQKEAEGQSLLKEIEDGKYFNEEYLAHLDLRQDDMTVLLTRTRIIQIRKKKMKVEWEVSFSDLQTISLQPNGILLILRNNLPGPFIPIPDKESKELFEKHVEEIVNEYNMEKRAVE
ncbi:8655_t:CDS:10 [Ambispora gerdemannii]|uniref:8655_t:CDS:1 n=1 Tax=Ambispora gerdemannii TaxID=144530 RepID=A0A9N9A5B1_9GLOM|nr:8655_t:CDS:10 [Ambispora gerdemannii]